VATGGGVVSALEPGPDDVESFADRFLDVFLDKGTLWLLVAVGVLSVAVGVAQLWRVLS
jgi:hypothetical protein